MLLWNQALTPSCPFALFLPWDLFQVVVFRLICFLSAYTFIRWLWQGGKGCSELLSNFNNQTAICQSMLMLAVCHDCKFRSVTSAVLSTAGYLPYFSHDNVLLINESKTGYMIQKYDDDSNCYYGFLFVPVQCFRREILFSYRDLWSSCKIGQKALRCYTDWRSLKVCRKNVLQSCCLIHHE